MGFDWMTDLENIGGQRIKSTGYLWLGHPNHKLYRLELELVRVKLRRWISSPGGT